MGTDVKRNAFVKISVIPSLSRASKSELLCAVWAAVGRRNLADRGVSAGNLLCVTGFTCFHIHFDETQSYSQGVYKQNPTTSVLLGKRWYTASINTLRHCGNYVYHHV